MLSNKMLNFDEKIKGEVRKNKSQSSTNLVKFIAPNSPKEIKDVVKVILPWETSFMKAN